MALLETVGELVVTRCWCGIQFAIPENLQRIHRQSTTHVVFCPLGHQAVSRATEADGLKKQLAQEQHLREQLETTRTNLMAERDGLERRVRAQKGVVTRVRNRAKNGMCPCCQRHFPELHKHMLTKHPEYQVDTDLPQEQSK